MIARAIVALCLFGVGLLGACRTEVLPAGDGGATADLARAGDLAQAGDLTVAAQCEPDCNRCTTGVCCGSICCNAGEFCDPSGTCRCGSSAACTGGNVCATGGPIMQGASRCGSICCGRTSPCPL